MDIPNNISGTEPVKAAAPKVWTSNYMKFLHDAAIFVGFWIAYNAHVTGRTVHEWFSMAFGVALLVHLGLSWRWVVNVAMRLFEKLPKMTLVGFVLNALLLLDFFMIMYTGLAMSRSVAPAFGLSAGGGREMRNMHELYSKLAIVLVLAHAALHWKWIVGVVRRRLDLVSTRC
jgi:hypothetical protein